MGIPPQDVALAQVRRVEHYRAPPARRAVLWNRRRVGSEGKEASKKEKLMTASVDKSNLEAVLVVFFFALIAVLLLY